MNIQAAHHHDTVLILHQHPRLRDPLSSGLLQLGYNVTCVHDRVQAFRLIDEKSFDLVICDVTLAGPNDKEFLQQIKHISPETEVVLASGFSTLDIDAESLTEPSFDYIARPFSVRHLSVILEKALERRRLRARVKYLEELNRTKEEVIQTLAHELRSPMSGISGLTTLHLSGMYGAINTDQQESLEQVKNTIEASLKLITRVLDHSRLPASRLELAPETIYLKELVRDVQGALQAQATLKHIALQIEGPEDLRVRVDRARLWQVLMNLCGNAIKFTDQGSVTIQIHPLVEENQVGIKVRDTGIGISENELSRLFKEAQPLSLKCLKRGGSGLGLSLCRKTLDLMGGTISASSQPGQGTIMSIVLPSGLEPQPICDPEENAALN